MDKEKTDMKCYFPIFLLLTLLLSVACGDDDNANNNSAVSPVGRCHLLFDFNGESIGTHGDCDNQSLWEEQALLAEEMAWLDTAEDLEFTNEHQAFTEIIVSPYPIPAQADDVITVSIFTEGAADALSNLKLAVIDESRNLRFTHAQTLITGSNSVQFLLEGFTIGQSYRMYYQILNTQNSTYFEGYGDFFVCDELPVLEFESCL